MWKTFHVVCDAEIWTHCLFNMSFLPLPGLSLYTQLNLGIVLQLMYIFNR